MLGEVEGKPPAAWALLFLPDSPSSLPAPGAVLGLSTFPLWAVGTGTAPPGDGTGLSASSEPHHPLLSTTAPGTP